MLFETIDRWAYTVEAPAGMDPKVKSDVSPEAL